jgi:hypothetical protein
MKTLQKLFALTVLLALSPLAYAQQNLLTQTTLSAAIAGSFLGQGVSSITNPPPQLVQVASATGIVGLSPNLGINASQPTQSAIYVDRELMLVTAVNGTTLTVVRGYGGTVAAPHTSGTMVLAGPPRFFYVQDPGGTSGFAGIGGVACTAANVVVSPWVNYRTGWQWLCSSVTGTWVPGWNNPMPPAATVTVASVAGATVPSGPYFSVSGTNAITSWTIPLGFNGTSSGGGCFTTIPTGIFTWTAAGNIAIAGTTTAVNIPVVWCWNASTSKWQPSRIA